MPLSGLPRCRTVRMVAPATTCRRDSSGRAPGAAIRARAVRTWCRHCRRSNAAGALGDRPPLPVSMRVDPPRPGQPAGRRPSGIGGWRDRDRRGGQCPRGQRATCPPRPATARSGAASHGPEPTPAAASARQPGRHHGQAPDGGPVEPPRRPAGNQAAAAAAAPASPAQHRSQRDEQRHPGQARSSTRAGRAAGRVITSTGAGSRLRRSRTSRQRPHLDPRGQGPECVAGAEHGASAAGEHRYSTRACRGGRRAPRSAARQP